MSKALICWRDESVRSAVWGECQTVTIQSSDSCQCLAQLEAGHNSTSPRKAQELFITNAMKLYFFFFCFFLCAICVCTHIRCLPQSFSTLFIKAISCWTQSSPVPDSVARLLQRYSPCLSSAGIIGSHYTYPDSFSMDTGIWAPSQVLLNWVISPDPNCILIKVMNLRKK